MSNTFGRLLDSWRTKKQIEIDSAWHDLLKRNGLDPHNYDARIWELREVEVKLPSGGERVELRLYKLVDAAVIEMKAEVSPEVHIGIRELSEFPSDPSHPAYYDQEEKESW